MQDYFKSISAQGRRTEKVFNMNNDLLIQHRHDGELTDSTGSRGDGTTRVHNMNEAHFDLLEKR